MNTRIYKSVFLSGVLVCLVLYFSTFKENSENNTEVKKMADQIIFPKKEEAPTVTTDSVEIIVNRNENEAIVSSSTNDYISNEIEAVLSDGNDSSEIDSLEKVKTMFPQIANKVVVYQVKIKKQNRKLANYKSLVAQKNALHRDGVYVSEQLQYELEDKKNELMLAARELGKESMEINAAIRRQAVFAQRTID